MDRLREPRIVAALVGGALLLVALGLALGYLTDDEERELAAAVPLAAAPAAVEVSRLSAVGPLPELRPQPRPKRAAAKPKAAPKPRPAAAPKPSPRPKPSATRTKPRPSAAPAPRPARSPARRPRRSSPRPVTIVGSG